MKKLTVSMEAALVETLRFYGEGKTWVTREALELPRMATMEGLISRGLLLKSEDRSAYTLTSQGHEVATDLLVAIAEATARESAMVELAEEGAKVVEKIIMSYGKSPKPGPRPVVEGEFPARDFPAISAYGVVTVRHSRYCREFGHASYSVGGLSMLTCPRCGFKAKTEVPWSPEELAAIHDTVPRDLRLTGQEMADMIDAKGQALFNRK